MRLLLFALVVFSIDVSASDETADADVFAQLGDNVVITQQMMDAAFSRIPEGHRLVFIRDGNKVETMVNNMLVTLALANDARAKSYDQDTLVAERLRLAADKELAEAWLDQLVASAPLPDLEQLARERYQLEKDSFVTQPTFDFTQLLISGESRGEEEALAKATGLKAELSASPERFDSLVMEHSDDPSAEKNQGKFKRIRPGEMVPSFEEALFAMENAGDISEPVKTVFGYHLIRLDGKEPARQQAFEEVRDTLMRQEREKFRTEERSRVIERTLDRGDLEVPEEAVIKMLKRYFGEDFENAPQFSAEDDS